VIEFAGGGLHGTSTEDIARAKASSETAVWRRARFTPGKA
jgi:hypothetical protein